MLTHNVDGLLLGWYLKNVRPATELGFENYSVGLRNYYFGTSTPDAAW